MGALAVLLWCAAGCQATIADRAGVTREPACLILTWQRDPTTTMTIDWHTAAPDADLASAPRAMLRYKRADGDSNDWNEANGESHPFPFSDRMIHRVELTSLTPSADYHFKLEGFDRRYSFRTMPAELTEPLVFATGGDVRHRQQWMERTNTIAMQHDPQFIVWGGDLAYANGRKENLDRWMEWCDAVMNTLITDDGRVIPIIVGIGNHEVDGGYYFRADRYEDSDAGRARIAPYFYSLFAFPGQPGYGVLDFGNYLSIVLLDTDHANPIEGRQTRWLQSALAHRRHVSHVIPVYHVPAYPSHRPYDGRVPSNVRTHFIPLFEQHHVRIAFANHDHAYKRTHPIRNGRISPDGIVYVGDGAWGVSTRSGDSRDEWYIDQFASVRHAIIVTLRGEEQHLLMVNEHGDIIDEYSGKDRQQ